MKLKLNKAAQEAKKTDIPLHIGSSDGFWYDLTFGGYFKPEDVLEDKNQIKEVKKAIQLLVELEHIYADVAEGYRM